MAYYLSVYNNRVFVRLFNAIVLHIHCEAESFMRLHQSELCLSPLVGFITRLIHRIRMHRYVKSLHLRCRLMQSSYAE